MYLASEAAVLALTVLVPSLIALQARTNASWQKDNN